MTDLFEFVENSIGFREVPVQKKLVDNSKVVSSLCEAREDLLDIAFGLLLEQPAKPSEESRLTGGTSETRTTVADSSERSSWPERWND